MNKIEFHPDVKIFNHDVFYDYRGELWTTWEKSSFEPKLDFIHDKVSTSRKNVLRGIHGDTKSWKLIECLYGELYFILVDNRVDSPNYKKWSSMMLSDKKRQSVLIPPMFGNGFLVMSEYSIFHYKWAYTGEYPDVKDQFTIKWDDPKINIEWPIINPILQKRDK
jgi:dTDP-4-dehydrorhamnose 3,5-epimerase